MEFQQGNLQLFAHIVTNRGEWFIQKQQPRPFSNGPGEGNPLLLPAGKGLNLSTGQLLQGRKFQQFIYNRCRL